MQPRAFQNREVPRLANLAEEEQALVEGARVEQGRGRGLFEALRHTVWGENYWTMH
jgi:hypothetical protein